VIRHRVCKLPLNAISHRHSHNEHVPIEISEGFDNAYIGKLVDPKDVSALSAFQEWSIYLFVDVLQRSVGMLAVANTMAPHTSLAGIFLAFDQHLDVPADVVAIREWVARRSTVHGCSTTKYVDIETPSRCNTFFDCGQPQNDCRVETSSR
jgi:hypothetical protein